MIQQNACIATGSCANAISNHSTRWWWSVIIIKEERKRENITYRATRLKVIYKKLPSSSTRFIDEDVLCEFLHETIYCIPTIKIKLILIDNHFEVGNRLRAYTAIHQNENSLKHCNLI